MSKSTLALASVVLASLSTSSSNAIHTYPLPSKRETPPPPFMEQHGPSRPKKIKADKTKVKAQKIARKINRKRT